MARMRKTAKPKLPSHERIDRNVDPLGAYDVLDAMLKKYRPDLTDADCRIALTWRLGLKRNKDGQLVLGKCVKVSDLHKQYAGFDFVIVLNEEMWREMKDHQKAALMHHELCHAQVAYDQNGNPKKDARGRQCFRTKKHDIEEFGDVIAAHGCYKADLEQFCLLAIKSKRPPQPEIPGIEAKAPEEPPATIPMPSANGHHEPSANGHASANGHHAPSANGHTRPRPVPAAARNRVKKTAAK